MLKAVLEDAGNSVWEWNVQSNEAHFSRQWMSMLGYDAHDMGGDISFWERLVHPDDRDKTFAAFALLVRGEVKTVNCEYRILHRDGDYRWVLNMARVVARDGRPLRMIVVQTDVTRQKQNEEALRESDAILREEFARNGLEGKVWQYFAIIPDFKSVGVKNGLRSFEWPVILRAVNTRDAMTATVEDLPFPLLQHITTRITAEVPGVNRVLYDLTPKPTGTIEWE